VAVSFDNMNHEWTMKFIEHRVADRRMLRLIQKWLKDGVSEDGQWSETNVGTPQGSGNDSLNAKDNLRLKANSAAGESVPTTRPARTRSAELESSVES
jgi:retron-type reverse transcriptase